jgi:hypothetical protein
VLFEAGADVTQLAAFTRVLGATCAWGAAGSGAGCMKAVSGGLATVYIVHFSANLLAVCLPLSKLIACSQQVVGAAGTDCNARQTCAD